MDNKKNNHGNEARSGGLQPGRSSSAQKTKNEKSNNGGSSSSREKPSSENKLESSPKTGGLPRSGTSSAQKTKNEKSNHHNGGSSSSRQKPSSENKLGSLSKTGGLPRSGSSSAQKTENTQSNHHNGGSTPSRTTSRPAPKIPNLENKKSGKNNATSPGRKSSSQIKHPRHPCQLTLMRQGNPFECSGCKELGFGRRYLCEKEGCHFILHEQCANARPTDVAREHPFKHGCRFKFIWRPSEDKPAVRICDACRRDVQGYAYRGQSPKTALYLHPCCMNLGRTLSSPNGKMKLTLQGKVTSDCRKCERKGMITGNNRSFRGWSYLSPCKKYCFHVYCMKKLIAENWSYSPDSISLSSGRSLVPSARISSALVKGRESKLTGVLSRIARACFGILLSFLFGHPGPMFTALFPLLEDMF